MPSEIQIKRAYEDAQKSDGFRVLVDRLWPRGVNKDDAHVDLWLKEISPSTELRKWFGHDPDKWPEFKKRYRHELAQHKDTLRDLLQKADGKTLTLVFGARDTEHNNAVVIKEYLGRLKEK